MADFVDRALWKVAGWPVIGAIADRALEFRGTIPFRSAGVEVRHVESAPSPPSESALSVERHQPSLGSDSQQERLEGLREIREVQKAMRRAEGSALYVGGSGDPEENIGPWDRAAVAIQSL